MKHDWQEIGNGVFRCQVSSLFLSLYVVIASDGKWWPSVNGRQVLRGYDSLGQAKLVAAEVARRLLKEALLGLEEE